MSPEKQQTLVKGKRVMVHKPLDLVVPRPLVSKNNELQKNERIPEVNVPEQSSQSIPIVVILVVQSTFTYLKRDHHRL